MGTPADRRPLKTRDKLWAKRLATALARRGVTPNAISLYSVAFAGLAMLAFIATRRSPVPPYRAVCLLIAIVGMQLRLLCNLLDGMVAVEAGAGVGKFGEIFNDLPDRVGDILIFAGAGICAGGTEGPLLGLGAGIGCVLTAYVRVLGKSMGAHSHFVGPMAKPHRMATMSVACLVGILVVLVIDPLLKGRYLHVWMVVPLVVVCVGCLVTCVNRLRLIVQDLRAA
ncbi:MAG TPA: CDP-alcohol phosphatidyltransferase family protein [Tepidisphaeraceae bacterium]|jgi:phosphatidylglycerophosphate synthase